MNTAPKKLFVIDAMAMAFRNFHAFGQRPLMTSTGIHTSAVFGSALFMLKLIEDEKPDYLICATDSKEPTFRHDLYPAYKANRSAMPEDLAGQLPYFFELFSAMNIPVLRQPGVEADDLIGSIVRRFSGEGVHCYIVSGDKDFMQLVGPHISMYSPKKAEPAQIVSYKAVEEKFGCKPEQVIDALALIGDTSDNVPGVHGIGDKGAAKLISEYHTLEGIYENLERISNTKLRNALANDRENAFLSRQLVTIKVDLPLEVTLDETELNAREATANERLLDLFTRMEFRGLTTKVKDALGTSAQPAKDAPPPPTDPVDRALAIELAQNPESPSNEKYGKTYLLANSPELLTKLCQELQGANVFSFDTETTGLDRIADVPIGISVSVKSETAWYVPLVPEHLTGWLTPDIVKDMLAPHLMDPLKTKIAHNLKFDLQMMHNAGVTVVGPFGDTMLASYVLNPLSREHGLDYCAVEALGFRKIPTSALMGEKFERPMRQVPIDQLATYACEDADVVMRLHEHYLPKLREADLQTVYENIEMPLVPILARMEQTGIHIDADALGDISAKLDARIKELELIIYQEAGEKFNINSPKQLQVILFEKMELHTKLGLTRLKKTKTGFSTDVNVLEAMSEHPLPAALLTYRMLAKLKNTYVDTLPQLLHPKTNRIHTSFHQTGTATGRLSSSDPNLQNIPVRTPEGREIRRAFCASKADRLMVSADYSQVELRLLAHISQDAALQEAFASNQDIHTATASKIFGVAPSEVTPNLRSSAKAINFGIIYGMGPQRLARDTGVSMSEAKSFIEKYFAGFPKIREYIDQAKAEAREHGYSTTITGRRRPIPEIHSKDRAVMVNGENMAVNTPIQGSAADLVKLAMIEVQRRLDESGLDAQLLLQVHDELVFECAASIVDRLKVMVKESMEHAMRISVPLRVEVGSGHNWLDAH